MIRENLYAAESNEPQLIEEESADRSLRAWLIFAGILGFIVVILQGFWHPSVPLFSNIYIPDSLILYRGNLSSFSIDWRSWTSSTSDGLLLFYGPFKFIDSSLLFIPNLAMWLTSIWAAYRLFIPIHERAAQFAVIAIVFNPYLLLSLSGPTKELPLTMLVLLFLSLETKWKRIPYFIPIILITYIIRDGYAFMMAGWLVLHLFLPRPFWPFGRVAIVLVPLLVLMGFRTFVSPIGIFRGFEGEARLVGTRAQASEIGARNIERALESLDDPWLIAQEYGFRLAANGFSDLVRPELVTISNRISLIGVGYFSHAFFLAIGLCGVTLACISPSEDERLRYIAWFILLAWAVVSLILFVQPRYLMPITPIALGVYGSRAVTTRVLIAIAVVVASIAGVVFLALVLDISPTIPVDSTLKPPFFLFSPG